MVAIKLFLQSLAGVAAVGSAVAGGYQLMKIQDNDFEYLVVNSGTLPTSNQETTTLNTGKDKNYQCQDSVKPVVFYCEVFKTSSETASKSLDLEKITSQELLLKEAIVADTNYVLKVQKSSSKLSNISLVTKDSTKTFANLSNKYQLGSDLTNVKTNLIIVQSINLSSSSTSITTTTGKFQCVIEDSQEKIECDVYKTTSDKTSNDFAFTDFSSISLITNASEVKDNGFFVLDLKSKKYSKEEFRNKKISLSHVETANTSTVTKISDFIFDQAVVGHLSPTESKFGYPIAPSNEVYYVAQTTSVANESSPELELFTTKTDSSASSKNFKCQISGQTTSDKTDISCQMFALSTFDTTKNSILFETLKTSKTEIKTKAALTAAKYLKLKINTTNMSSLNWTSTSDITIDIISTVTPANSSKPKYASLKLLAKEEKEKFHGRTQFVVAKADATFTPSVTGTLTFKCKVGSTEPNAECDVYKFAAQPSTTDKTYKDLIFTNISKVTLSTDITANNFYLVDLKTSSKYDLTLDSSKQVIAVTNGSTSTPTFNFNVESPLLGAIDTNKTTGTFIFLK